MKSNAKIIDVLFFYSRKHTSPQAQDPLVGENWLKKSVRGVPLWRVPAERGPAAARNLAAGQGQAEFLAFLDDDDEWLTPRLGEAISTLSRQPRVVLVAGDAQLRSGGRFLDSPPPQGGEARDHGALSLDCSICTSTVTMRRDDFEAVDGFDEELRRAEDYDLWLRLTQDGRRAHLLPRTLTVYEDRGGLSSDPVAMARATLAVLERSARMPEHDRLWRDRLGRLQAVVSHGLAKEGRFSEARELAFRALAGSPSARVSWTSILRSTLRIRF